MPLRLIRSYDSPLRTDRSHPWTIADAAVATASAPTFFKPHTIIHAHESYQYEDAGVHGLNNPIICCWDECESIFPHPEHPHCIVSLGNGMKRHQYSKNRQPPSNRFWESLRYIFGVPGRLKGLFKHLERQATLVEDRHLEMQRLMKKEDPK